MIYKGKDLKKTITDHMRSKHFHNLKYFGDLDKIIAENYEITKKKIYGHKLMYVRTTIVGMDNINLYIPTMVEIEIPYHSIIFTDYELNISRTNQAIIKNVYDPTFYQQFKYHDAKPNFITGTQPSIAYIDKKLGNDHIFGADTIYPLFDANGTIVSNLFKSDLFHLLTDKHNYKCYGRVEKINDPDLSTLYSMYELDNYRFNNTIKLTKYHPNEKIVIDDFDILPVPCSKGFHFFKNLDDLKYYFNT